MSTPNFAQRWTPSRSTAAGKGGPSSVVATRRRWSATVASLLAVATLWSLAAPSSAEAQFFDCLPGFCTDLSVDESAVEAPRPNVLSGLVPQRKRVNVPVGLSRAVFDPVEIAWHIEKGPPDTISATESDVVFSSGTAVIQPGSRSTTIPVDLLPRAGGPDRQFTIVIDRAVASRSTVRLYKPKWVKTIRAAIELSFGCEARDQLMSVQVPPDGNPTWCPTVSGGVAKWTKPILVNGIRFEPAPGTTFVLDANNHVLTTNGGVATPLIKCSSCKFAESFTPRALTWTTDNSGADKFLALSPDADLFGFKFAVAAVTPIKFTSDHSALLQTYLGTPPSIPFVNYQINLILRTQSPTGLELHELRVHADYIPLGKFTIHPFDLYYDPATQTWGGNIGVQVPLGPSAADIRKAQTHSTATDLRTADPNAVARSLKPSPSQPGRLPWLQDKLTDFLSQPQVVVNGKVVVSVAGAPKLTELALGTMFNPAYPIGSGLVFLKSLSGAYFSPFSRDIPGYGTLSAPFGVQGGIGIALGPQIKNLPSPLLIDGTLSYLGSEPWQLIASGVMSAFGIEVGSGSVRYTNGTSVSYRMSFGKRFESGGYYVGLNAQMSGDLTFEPLSFFGSGSGEISLGTPDTVIHTDAYCLDFGLLGRLCFPETNTTIPGVRFSARGEGALSTNGVAACAGGSGARYRWDDKSVSTFLGCSSDTLRAQLASAARPAVAPRRFRLPAGLPYEVIRVRGHRIPARLRITGPKGFEFVSPTDRRALLGARRRVLHLVDARRRYTWVLIKRPAAGTYTVRPIRGAYTSVAHAHGLRRPAVRARVSGRGQRRILRYNVVQARSQSTTFFEKGGGGARALGTVRGPRRGALRFRPAPLRPGRRVITAVTVTSGIPQRQRRVASYLAREPVLRAPRVRTRTRRGGVLFTWTRVRGAVAYDVHIVLRNKRRLYYRTPPRQRRLRLSRADLPQSGSVSVNAVDRITRPGRRGRARFR